MNCIPRLIILASFGCNYFFSAIACETLHDGFPGSDHPTLRSPVMRAEMFFNLLAAHPKLIHTEHVLIQPNTQPMCVVVVESTTQFVNVPEFPRDNFHSFKNFKGMLLSNDFTVYEFMHAYAQLPSERQVIFTHEYIRDDTFCTTATVTTKLTDYSAFEYKERRQHHGLEHYIWHSNVTFIEKQRKDSFTDADLLGPVNFSSGIPCIQALLNLVSICPDLISMNRAQIHPNPDFFCVVVIKSTLRLKKDREFPYQDFAYLKNRLLAVGFTVYEYDHSQASRLQPDRQVLLTHDSFRDEAQCTIESISRVSRLRFRGTTKFINSGDVIFLNHLPDGVGHPAIPQTTPNSAPQAASGRAQASCVQPTNVTLQQSISEAKRKRQSGQDVGEDVGGVPHKGHRSSSSIAVGELHLSVVDAASSSHRDHLDVAFDQSQMMELPSWIETATAFHYKPDASSAGNLPPSVSNYPPMEYREILLSERDWSIRSSGPQQLIAGFDPSQMELASWGEIASALDVTPNVSPSLLGGFLKDLDDMSLSEQLEFISNFPGL